VGVLLSIAVLVGSFLIRVNAGDATTALRLSALERRIDQVERDQREAALAQQQRQERLSSTLTDLQVRLARLTRGTGRPDED
jgi:hypothetical protein